MQDSWQVEKIDDFFPFLLNIEIHVIYSLFLFSKKGEQLLPMKVDSIEDVVSVFGKALSNDFWAEKLKKNKFFHEKAQISRWYRLMMMFNKSWEQLPMKVDSIEDVSIWKGTFLLRHKSDSLASCINHFSEEDSNRIRSSKTEELTMVESLADTVVIWL